MNPKTLILCLALVSTGATAAELPTIQSQITFDGPDRIRISWATQPGEVYLLQTSTDLAQPWEGLQTTPPVLCATGNEFAYQLTATNRSQFFRVGRMNILPIPAGSFQMGGTLGEGWFEDELPVHTVKVSAFYMDPTEVTKALWDDVYGWAITHGYTFDNRGAGKADTHPVHSVSWYDVAKWCNARSEREERIPAYYTDPDLSVVYKTGRPALYVNWDAGYRLPTEAEWEYAARGGLSGKRFPWGDKISHSQANYYSLPYSYDESPTSGYHPTYWTGGEPYTSPVGAFPPNAYGLYDVAGNVWEWCWDWYSDYYDSSLPSSDPHGSASGSRRVVRGGSWTDDPTDCRVTVRYYGLWPGPWRNVVGVRSVLPPDQK